MRIRAAALLLPLLVLGACSSGSADRGGSGTPAASASASPDTVVADPVPADQLPAASGAIGEMPALTFPAGDPPSSLQRVVLTEGTGPATRKGDWLITNYLGQVWAERFSTIPTTRRRRRPFRSGSANWCQVGTWRWSVSRWAVECC